MARQARWRSKLAMHSRNLCAALLAVICSACATQGPVTSPGLDISAIEDVKPITSKSSLTGKDLETGKKAASSMASLVSRFASSDWSTVRSAKESLESLQREAIPELLNLLGRDDRVPLQDTADLIYPGAKTFWGHGEILDYDIAWLSVRAGWALEELTFQAFGFQEGEIDSDALLKAVMSGKADVPLSDVAPAELSAETKRARRSEAVARAVKWWSQASAGWNRLDAVAEALKSNDPVRQVQVLDWLRFGETTCNGLTREVFTARLMPEVRRLTGASDPTVKQQADYLARDFDGHDWSWLDLKQDTNERSAGRRQTPERQPPPPDRPIESRSKTQFEKLNEAIAPYVEKARTTWPPVRARFLAGLPEGAALFATVQLRDGAGRIEQVFVKVESIEAGRISGIIWNDIHTVSGYAKGQRHEFPESELIDWTISNADGTEEGNVVGTFLDTWNWNEH